MLLKNNNKVSSLANQRVNNQFSIDNNKAIGLIQLEYNNISNITGYINKDRYRTMSPNKFYLFSYYGSTIQRISQTE